MKVLLISRWKPFPADNGAKIRVWNVIKTLAQVHEMSLITFEDSDRIADAAAVDDELHAVCSRVEVLPYQAFQPSGQRARAAFLSPKPRSMVDTYSIAMRDAIRAEVNRLKPDVLIASQLDMVQYAVDVPEVSAVLEEGEVTVYRDAVTHAPSISRRLRALLTWIKLRAYVRRTLPRFDACTVVSDKEFANFAAIAPSYKGLRVVPNAIDVASYRREYGARVPVSVVFTGALTYFANYDAAAYLISEVWPLIREAQPDAQLKITGSTSGVDISPYASTAGVCFTGYVDDVRPVVAQSCVAAVPLRKGGGTRLKILEAMALGTPVVATRKGAEGLNVTHGQNILLADEPGEFARHVLSLFADAALHARIAEGGRQLVAEQYDWATVGQQVRSIVDKAGRTRVPS